MGLPDPAQSDGSPTPSLGGRWLSHSCTLQHHKIQGSSHPVSTHSRMTQWPAGRDCKRSFHFPFCPGQDADDVPDKCLFSQSLKTPTTCPGILSHSIYSSVQECHYFLLYPLQTRLSISFLSWSLNEYPHPFRKTWTISRHCTFPKIFPVAVALTTKWPGILLPKNFRFLLST